LVFWVLYPICTIHWINKLYPNPATASAPRTSRPPRRDTQSSPYIFFTDTDQEGSGSTDILYATVLILLAQEVNSWAREKTANSQDPGNATKYKKYSLDITALKIEHARPTLLADDGTWVAGKFPRHTLTMKDHRENIGHRRPVHEPLPRNLKLADGPGLSPSPAHNESVQKPVRRTRRKSGMCLWAQDRPATTSKSTPGLDSPRKPSPDIGHG